MSRRPRSPSRRTLAAQEARIRAAHAISLQRANPSWSLSRAAREAHTTVPTVRRHMPTAVNRDTRGHWHATSADRERFTMSVTTVEHGTVPLTVAGSRKRALVGAHHAAINSYLATGNPQRLDALQDRGGPHFANRPQHHPAAVPTRRAVVPGDLRPRLLTESSQP